MAHYLPPAIMRFFQPRPSTEFKPSITKRKMPDYMGVYQFVHHFDNDIPIPEKQITPQELRVKRKKKTEEVSKIRIEKHLAAWDPKGEAEHKTDDAYKTLFVARLSYDITDADLKDEFEYYGTITKVHIVKDKADKSRGYGFVEFESSRDLKEAYNDADGRKIAGRRILVDVERGRTVKNWRPRRLAGGLGGTRIGSETENQKFSGREPPRSGSGSGSGSGSSSGSSSSRTSSRGDRSDRDRDRRSRRSDRDRGGDRGGDRGDRSRRSDRGGDRERRSDRDRRR